ncbi:MAG: protein translocase subunit SecF [Pelagimonas sp.]|jgi:preprotein translocase SecF subunit|nr:protein translocase subunit SecF [Pelagimonas sp.]
MRLKLVPEKTNWDFFSRSKLWLGFSLALMLISLGSFFAQGLNFGIDFRGGTTIRTESTAEVEVGAYRDALTGLGLGDVVISEVFDPNFREDQHVAMIRIGAQDGQQAVANEVLQNVEAALGQLLGGAATVLVKSNELTLESVQGVNFGNAAPTAIEAGAGGIVLTYQEGLTAEARGQVVKALKDQLQADAAVTYAGYKTVSVESVGPKVSGELIQTAVIAVALAIAAVLFYIWLRFEWQFAAGAVAALVHDVLLTIGVFSALQIRFDLAIIAALLTIVGYSLNDTVVVFDRVRENLIRYKSKDLKEVMNLSINETLSRTFMTSVTTLLALISLFVLGGDVIRGFVFAMIWGVVVGTYSSIFVASAILLRLGVKRDWSKPTDTTGNQFGNVDA